MAPRLRTLPPRLAVLDVRVARPAPKEADPHYLTPEHRAWREAVLQRAGGQCQSPDCRTVDRGRARRLIADHIVELKDNGAALDLRNGQALCLPCHTRKTIAERAARMARPT